MEEEYNKKLGPRRNIDLYELKSISFIDLKSNHSKPNFNFKVPNKFLFYEK